MSYDGLTKNEFFKQYFKRFNLNHSYRSTLTTSPRDQPQLRGGRKRAADGHRPKRIRQLHLGAPVQRRELGEQLSPLIGVDMTIKTEGENEPQIKVELKRDRNVAFG